MPMSLLLFWVILHHFTSFWVILSPFQSIWVNLSPDLMAQIDWKWFNSFKWMLSDILSHLEADSIRLNLSQPVSTCLKMAQKDEDMIFKIGIHYAYFPSLWNFWIMCSPWLMCDHITFRAFTHFSNFNWLFHWVTAVIWLPVQICSNIQIFGCSKSLIPSKSWNLWFFCLNLEKLTSVFLSKFCFYFDLCQISKYITYIFIY